MANTILIRRGTTAQINTAKGSNSLIAYEPIFNTSTSRLEISTGVNSTVALARYADISAVGLSGDAADLTGTLPAARFTDASHGNRGGGTLHPAVTTTVNGFMSASDKIKLDDLKIEELLPEVSGRDYTNGFLINTSIASGAENGEAFLFEGSGNSYGSGTPFDFKVQGYLFGNAIINYGAISNGTPLPAMYLFNNAGFLSLWIAYAAYWQGFTISAHVVSSSSIDGPARNRVTSVQNLARPAGRTKEVAVPVNQAILASGGTISSSNLTFTTTTTGAFIQVRGDSSSYLHFANSTNTTQRGFVGYGNPAAPAVMQLTNNIGALELSGGNVKGMTFVGTSITGHLPFSSNTASATYAISGWTTNASYGGVIGWSANQSYYGILGYNNAYSLYGSGQIFTTGQILSQEGFYVGHTQHIVMAPNAASGYCYLRPNGRNTTTGETVVHPNGSLYVNGTLVSSSDRSKKENFKPIENALDSVCALQGLFYNRIGSDEQEMGLVAQDVLPVYPQAVRKFQDGTLGVEYPQLSAAFVEAFKDVRCRLEESERKVEDLEARLARLEALLGAE